MLQAVGGAETIKGIQANGVIATIKHWIGNEQEMYRMDIIPHGLMKALSANIDDRTLHELYAWPFAEGIRAGVGAVMTSYNDVSHRNPRLMAMTDRFRSMGAPPVKTVHSLMEFSKTSLDSKAW